MPQSLAGMLTHIIFSTKHRRGLIVPELCRPLAGYLAGAFKEMDSPAVEINAVADHVHVLCNLSKTHALAEVIGEVKKGSSKWAKTRAASEDFYWQNGYGAFSVSPSMMDDVVSYVRRQEEHHRIVSFQDEFREFCRRHGVDLDERYAWA